MLKEKAEKIIDEISVFYSSEKLITELKRILKYNGTGKVDLKFKSTYNEPLKSTPNFSLFVLDRVFYRIKINKEDLSFTFSNIFFPDVKKRTIKLEKYSDIEEFLFDDIINLCREVIMDLSDTFDCCSRYTECSDCIACIQPMFEVAVHCRYWGRLQNGIVIYGKNRNIDNQGIYKTTLSQLS